MNPIRKQLRFIYRLAAKPCSLTDDTALHMFLGSSMG